MDNTTIDRTKHLLERYREAQRICVYDEHRLWKKTPKSEADYNEISGQIDRLKEIISNPRILDIAEVARCIKVY